MRLDRLVSIHTTLTRSEIRRLIAAGGVTVDGRPALRPEAAVDSRSAVAIGGEALQTGPLYLMMNKPAGVVSATRDGLSRTVVELVPPKLRRKGLFPAGRLDKETEGFLLLTDDGVFAHAILSPRRHVSKTYRAEISGALAPDAAERFAAGLALESGAVCRPASLEIVGRGEGGLTVARVVLREGMYHQVRRMVAACGGQVERLFREKIGGLALDPALAPGMCRPIAPGELERVIQGGAVAADEDENTPETPA